ncbi:fungal specific transcription factor domain-containing protein [Trichoderma breve]|uniref:Fungal specific transcription factor domain-containing protein n=1 Tax=Trichoderma breve TaxID=2034170 RepID=A0A9W9EF46_9HYPO|nr:fungal specific transcription factor domain-containing protein [Trichoderma breve]KAJ4865417.1 fungal specific transcription factor domain-containing protein [Trichoderma breve]
MDARAPRKSNRGRRAKACDSCSRRKIQCDADVPQCNWCKHHDLACTYRRLVANTKKKSPDHKIAQTPDSITRMEIILAQRLSQHDDDTQFEYLTSSQSDLRNATSFTGIPLFSEKGQTWIESRTGSRMTPQTLCSFGRQWHSPRRLYLDSNTIAASAQPCELPQRSTLERYAAAYCSSTICLIFPVLSEGLFVKTLDLAYSSPDSPSVVSARACVYSFLAVASILHIEDDSAAKMSSESYLAAARSLIPQVTQEMTGDGLQTLVTLAIVYYFLGDLQSMGLFLSIATRFIFALKAHANPQDVARSYFSSPSSSYQASSPPTSPVYDKNDRTHHLRDLFWTCYSLDKDLCIRTGQPSCLSDIHCDLTLPPDYSVMQNRHIQSHTIPDLGNRTVPMYPWELLLSQLKSRAYDALYSPMAHRKSQCELLESIRILDESLEQWRLSLPPNFRPTLTFGKMTPVSADVSMQSSMVRLAYYHFVAIVHRASGSRSTLVYLQVALHVITDDCFWVIIYYPISAILSLFSNILSSPLDETAPGDLEILKSAPTLFRSIPIRKLTLAELTHLKLLDAFSMELARLGELAIQKARGNVPTHG